jgi:hypothetical protein
LDHRTDDTIRGGGLPDPAPASHGHFESGQSLFANTATALTTTNGEAFDMTTRTLSASVAVAIGLAACAAPSQPFLDSLRTQCTAGDQGACAGIPSAQAQVNYERQEQANKVAAGILLGLGAAAAGAAAGYAAAHPAPVYYTPVIVCRWGC